MLKETFKLIKMAHKEWHLSHAQNLRGRMDSLKKRILILLEQNTFNKHYPLVGENEEKENTIQPPPPSCVFLTFVVEACRIGVSFMKSECTLSEDEKEEPYKS